MLNALNAVQRAVGGPVYRRVADFPGSIVGAGSLSRPEPYWHASRPDLMRRATRPNVMQLYKIKKP